MELFQPDSIMPEEFADLFRRKIPEGERGLMLAVLRDAVECFQKYRSASDRKGEALFRDARIYIFGEQDDWFFSFDSICDELGINPQYLREGLMRQAAKAHRIKSRPYNGSGRRKIK
ncbi:hypothetical protein A2757_02515 [Candidatus Giovannonibacteria bacterium RIFCSPHIGHO2_01_FULL_48_47]|nr:MAG: hypothetical protein A2757_02515 [Candidatus Giovannonibacteria bacterium RIFCSPHIGHO2_01_FULL_48_47]OGF67661.1 MAG: hypothetical protein A3D61_01790 [Candidatus Giovannonibacteria bacterium RIFCSPHIGHO2_02_FULL_48_15]OGF89834.1 MAG: hypothetical protein A3B26_03250 [Candidatus Giovannonibacteria bacterium RIFCSPLOWO2_01_FULL_48_47]OGF95291.1 MAG: hypothetical protein A2433_01000 [Candidatus Giovannonibacteria bacterium RIFOXYC1_FULL_48_8]OGF95804.1 MAG: hypothetical protein A2613_04075